MADTHQLPPVGGQARSKPRSEVLFPGASKRMDTSPMTPAQSAAREDVRKTDGDAKGDAHFERSRGMKPGTLQREREIFMRYLANKTGV